MSCFAFIVKEWGKSHKKPHSLKTLWTPVCNVSATPLGQVSLLDRTILQKDSWPITILRRKGKLWVQGLRANKCLDEAWRKLQLFYSAVLLIARWALTTWKWLPSTWSKSAPIKFLSRIKIAALGTKTLCFFLSLAIFFSVQNLTQQRYIY